MIVAGIGYEFNQIKEDHGVVTLKARVKMQDKATEYLTIGRPGFDELAQDAAKELGISVIGTASFDDLLEFADVFMFYFDPEVQAGLEYQTWVRANDLKLKIANIYHDPPF